MNKTKGPINLKEGAPVGSYEHTREAVSDALKKVQLFPGVDYYSVYLMYVYPERVICEVKGKFYEISYEMDSAYNVTFGKPVEVEQYYVPKNLNEDKSKATKESIEKELKEAGVSRTKNASLIEDFVIDDFISLKEANIDDDGYIDVILIEAGTNAKKKRHYPVSTVMESAAGYKGLKMYINHQTQKQEQDRPERDLREWASTIVESYGENGKAKGKVKVHDPWLKERLKDPVFKANVGLSINAGGKIGYGKINGVEMQIVEKIILEKQGLPATVDWVTEAGARGRVISKPLKENNAGGKKPMELKDASLKDLEMENPKLMKDLKESVVAQVTKEIKESEESKAKDKKQQDLEAENKRLKEGEAKTKQAVAVDALLKENKNLLDVAKERIREEMNASLFESEEKLKEAFGAKVKREVEYINKISPKGRVINMGSGVGAPAGSAPVADPLHESIASDLDKRFGVAEKKKEDKTEK